MEIKLLPVTREDVARIRGWLQDEDVAESWFGRYSYGDPAHLGYHPEEMDDVSNEDGAHLRRPAAPHAVGLRR